MKLRDAIGYYEVQACVDYGDVIVDYLKYEKTNETRKRGGCYSLLCEDTGAQKFYGTEKKLYDDLNNFIEDNKSRILEDRNG